MSVEQRSVIQSLFCKKRQEKTTVGEQRIGSALLVCQVVYGGGADIWGSNTQLMCKGVWSQTGGVLISTSGEGICSHIRMEAGDPGPNQGSALSSIRQRGSSSLMELGCCYFIKQEGERKLLEGLCHTVVGSCGELRRSCV